MKKFKSRKVNIIDKSKIIMIVGICPGRQRKIDSNFEVFHGNRTGDFIEKLIKDYNNIYLTNVFNYQSKSSLSKRKIKIGKKKLKRKINKIKPVKIICLGNTSKDVVLDIIKNKEIELLFLKHPSFILRFNKNIDEYINVFKPGLINI